MSAIRLDLCISYEQAKAKHFTWYIQLFIQNYLQASAKYRVSVNQGDEERLPLRGLNSSKF
jgi:hypothetical protein